MGLPRSRVLFFALGRWIGGQQCSVSEAHGDCSNLYVFGLVSSLRRLLSIVNNRYQCPNINIEPAKYENKRYLVVNRMLEVPLFW